MGTLLMRWQIEELKTRGTKNTKKIATAKTVSSSLGLRTMACTAPLVVPPALGRGRTGALFSRKASSVRWVSTSSRVTSAKADGRVGGQSRGSDKTALKRFRVRSAEVRDLGTRRVVARAKRGSPPKCFPTSTYHLSPRTDHRYTLPPHTGPRRPAPGRYRNGDCGTRGNQPRSRVDTGTGTSCPSSSCENVAGDIRGRAGCAAAAEACTSA